MHTHPRARLVACLQPSRRRARGRRWPSGASSSCASSTAGAGSESLQGLEGGAEGLDLQRAYELLEEAELAGVAAAQDGSNGGGDVLCGQGQISSERAPSGGGPGVSSVVALRRRLGLAGAGEALPVQPPLPSQKLAEEELGQDKEQEKEERRRRQRGASSPELPPLPATPQPPLRAKLQGVQAGWSAAQRAALSAGAWLWESMVAGGAGKRSPTDGSTGGCSGDLGLETLADNGAGASLLLPAMATSKPCGSGGADAGRDGREWGGGAQAHWEGLRPRRQLLGQLREQLLARRGRCAQGGQAAEAWSQSRVHVQRSGGVGLGHGAGSQDGLQVVEGEGPGRGMLEGGYAEEQDEEEGEEEGSETSGPSNEEQDEDELEVRSTWRWLHKAAKLGTRAAERYAEVHTKAWSRQCASPRAGVCRCVPGCGMLQYTVTTVDDPHLCLIPATHGTPHLYSCGKH